MAVLCPVFIYINMSKKMSILQQLYAIKQIIIDSFTLDEINVLSLYDLLYLLLLKEDIKEINTEEQQQILKLFQTVFPDWTISEVMPEPPETVTISYVIRTLDVARSTFYRSIDNKLLHRSGQVGNRPMYIKSEVDWLGAEARNMGSGSWVYSKLWKKKKIDGKSP